MAVRTGKRVLITGGSRGIGAEAVREFTARGASVAFLYHKSSHEAISLSSETGALNIRCNVANQESVEAALNVARTFFDGQIDTLICCAGVHDAVSFEEMTAERWHHVMNTNLNGAYYCAHEILPLMMKNQSGSVIFLSSVQGQKGAAGEAAYAAASAGLIGLTRSLAKEAGPYGVRVNCIAPGVIDTSMHADMEDDEAEELIEKTPLNRLGTTRDVVKAMRFLSSDEASFITGQVIGINGGLE